METLLKVKVKKLHPKAVVPKYSAPGDAGLDLTATEVDQKASKITYGTGLSVEIPEGYVGLLFPRSSIAKKQLTLANSVGVIDSGYRGEIKLVFQTHLGYAEVIPEKYSVGDRIGQLIIIPYPQIELEEVEELSSTVRGQGGFGSTGA